MAPKRTGPCGCGKWFRFRNRRAASRALDTVRQRLLREGQAPDMLPAYVYRCPVEPSVWHHTSETTGRIRLRANLRILQQLLDQLERPPDSQLAC